MSTKVYEMPSDQVMKPKYIEFCSGIGGMRAGLDAAGWDCLYAVDKDEDAVAVHRLSHGNSELGDVTLLRPEEIPDSDIWVAGFPCQPFSTSGNRLGFSHQSGNVFEHIVRLIETKEPSIVILENVEGLLTNKSGHTYSVILSSLTELGYRVDWLTIDLNWFGVPQTRPRLIMIASKKHGITEDQFQNLEFPLLGSTLPITSPFDTLLESLHITKKLNGSGSISNNISSLVPRIGKPKYAGKRIYGSHGYAFQDKYISYSLSPAITTDSDISIADIVAPNFKYGEFIRSGRYYARGGPTKLCLRKDPLSHCIGTSLGGAPLFAVPLSYIKEPSDRSAFIEFANWHREQDGLLVMRVKPDRAILLFGPLVNTVHIGMSKWDVGDTRKYVLIGNMVAPIVAFNIANIVNNHIIDSRNYATSGSKKMPKVRIQTSS